jgi:hypothetical protein
MSAPLVIGATGGSGTRVVARLARSAGYNLGTQLNQADDALAFRDFHDRWINRFVAAQNRSGSNSEVEIEGMAGDFQVALDRHLRDGIVSSDERWGWKAPRTIYLIPFLRGQFRNLKFIHVLRDGRDMCFSRNQNQLRKHGPAILGRSERWFRSEPIQSMLLWARVNLAAAAYGEANLGQDYFAVRFEDLCQAPVETTARLIRFLGARMAPEPIALAEISPPASLGRWRTQPRAIISRLERAGQAALGKFGYPA